MRAWRKFVAVILLVVFAPATILAAMPLQLCVGDDGHRVVERLFASDHHEDGAHAESVSTVTPQSQMDVDETKASESGCTDMVMLSGGQASVRSATSLDGTDLVNLLSVAGLACSQSHTVISVCDSGAAVQPARRVQCDPLLAIRATTVLLN